MIVDIAPRPLRDIDLTEVGHVGGTAADFLVPDVVTAGLARAGWPVSR
jgi:hypothetical protein